MKEFIQALESEFAMSANPKIAAEQKAYLKNRFEFYGIKTEARRTIQKPFLNKSFLPSKREAFLMIKKLWLRPEREFHYFSQELAFRYLKNSEVKDIELYEFMVTHNSWWDTVDFIATKLMGAYFKSFPETSEKYVSKWIDSKNIWLQRCALLFQLKYKDELDTHLLSKTINALLGSKEFFINKAIGWVLRQHSRVNPNWVIDFVESTPELAPLSRKEALRLLE
jgi:3-methyladenine DNA glycosylase AlkD